MATGGTLATGGSTATGGAPATGGRATGGAVATGGQARTGGDSNTGGSDTGGNPGTGGRATGGSATGGITTGGQATGGSVGSGGAMATGGTAGTGGLPVDAGAPDVQIQPDTQLPVDTALSPDTGSGYSPCGNNPCKILPYGDSITFGVGDEGNGGYRGPLFANAVADGKKITFTGSQQNGPNTVSGQTFPKRNEGRSGWGISTVTAYSGGNAGIAILVPSPAFDTGNGGVPDIILLHIGTNDASSSSAAIGNDMATRLDGLVAKVTSAAPKALLVVAKILPVGWASAAINAYNNALPGIVDKYAGQGKHVVLVDMNTGFNSGTMFVSDNLHPNTSGYKFMADKWYAAIKAYLPM